jgi:class 3 adenylate cyclase
MSDQTSPDNIKLKFNPVASPPIKAVVVIADLEDFSRFFTQPDVHLYIPQLLNRIFAALNICLYGGEAYWIKDEPILDSLVEPIYSKYLGDGALFIWKYGNEPGGLKGLDVERLINRLSLLQKGFQKVLATCVDDVPLSVLPPRIRFGVSAGSVYQLTYENSDRSEYIGYAINLASRLQNYCRSIGFIASARVEIPEKTLLEAGYKKVITKILRGFPREVVIVDAFDYGMLDSRERDKLFDTIV